MRQEIEPASSWILVGFVTAEPQREFPRSILCDSFFLPFKSGQFFDLRVFVLTFFLRAEPTAYESFQARGPVGAVAAGLQL